MPEQAPSGGGGGAGGYDISASRSDAQSQAANQSAGTVINFGSGSVSTFAGPQTAVPNATSTAARNIGENSSAAPSLGEIAANTHPNWFLIGGLAIGALALVGALLTLAKKG